MNSALAALPVSYQDVADAADRIRPLVVETPLLEVADLSEAIGGRFFVKCENLQRTGSFKLRGGMNALASLSPEDRAKGIVAYSSGNHAQGVALAAHQHDIPAVIIMPADAPALKIANTRALGAEVVLYDRAGGESREDIGERLAADRGLTLIRPYDEPQVIAGQGTTGLEIATQAAELGVASADVLVCCGGGGLTSGIALALEAEAPGLRVRPCEPEKFDDTTRSLATGEIQHNTGQAVGSFQHLKLWLTLGCLIAILG